MEETDALKVLTTLSEIEGSISEQYFRVLDKTKIETEEAAALVGEFRWVRDPELEMSDEDQLKQSSRATAVSQFADETTPRLGPSSSQQAAIQLK